MLREIDNYFDQHEEPARNCLDALRHFVLGFAPEITEVWQYKMPFYRYTGKRFCYLWMDKKRNQPYLGFVEGRRMEHPQLLIEKRSRMKILLIDPAADLPIETMSDLLRIGIDLVR